LGCSATGKKKCIVLIIFIVIVQDLAVKFATESKTPFILNHGNKLRPVVSFKSRPIFPRERVQSTQGGPESPFI